MSHATPNLAPLEAGTRALVLGLGRTGLSCARYLRRKGLAVRVADTRAEPPGSATLHSQVPEAELRAGAFDRERVRRFAATWFDVADGHATERFVDRVVLPALAGERPVLAPVEIPAS